MEQNLPVVAKRIWETVRVMFFMFKNGILKQKLLLDLNLMLKRGNKIATKAKSIRNLMFQLYHHHHAGRRISPPKDYEFSCSNTPAYSLPKKANNFFACAFHTPPTLEEDDVVTVNAVKMALEMMVVEASPAPVWLPGFGRSPAVRQLRITDSPFPVRDEGDGGAVDKEAEEFIRKFYKELRKQTSG